MSIKSMTHVNFGAPNIIAADDLFSEILFVRTLQGIGLHAVAHHNDQRHTRLDLQNVQLSGGCYSLDGDKGFRPKLD